MLNYHLSLTPVNSVNCMCTNERKLWPDNGDIIVYKSIITNICLRLSFLMTLERKKKKQTSHTHSELLLIITLMLRANKGSTLTTVNLKKKKRKPWKAKKNGNRKMGKNSQSYTYFCFPTLLNNNALDFFISFPSQGDAIPFQHLHS